MKRAVKLAIIGLGNRGHGMLSAPIIPMAKAGDVEIVAVCDLLADRVEDVKRIITDNGLPTPYGTTVPAELLAIEEIEAVYIAVSWEAHVEVAVAAMEAGKFVGLEAGGAYDLEDCYRLVRTHERTGSELMLMENCCYGKREMMMINMVRQGVFGDVVHCNGAYCHDLRTEIIAGKEIKHYRLRNYIHRNGENYPTHEIGPIAKLLDINNGNRFVSLTSVSSCAKSMHQYVVDTKGPDHPLAKVDFKQGDVTTTLLTCAGGQTVCITLDTTRPRAYSRRFEVLGTKATYLEDNDSLFIDGNEEHRKHEWAIWDKMWGNAKEYEDEYLHPLWKDSVGSDMHGGIDHLVFAAFVEAVREGLHPPIDVYDAATYMAITVLSEQSVAHGGMAIPFPDFTAGKWTMRTDIADNAYTLDRLHNGQELYHVDHAD